MKRNKKINRKDAGLTTEQKFINTVLNCDADKFFELLYYTPLPKSLLEDIGVLCDVAFPLHYITICWDEILKTYDQYDGAYEMFYYNRKMRNNRIKEYFAKTYGLDMGYVPFDKYIDCTSACTPDETVEDILPATEQKLIAKGYAKEDIDLYVSVCKLDYESVERLLISGANPLTMLPREGNCMQRVCMACYLEDAEIDIVGSKALSIDSFYVDDLINYAAFEKMSNLLLPYADKFSSKDAN